jgi:hypothetical protein
MSGELIHALLYHASYLHRKEVNGQASERRERKLNRLSNVSRSKYLIYDTKRTQDQPPIAFCNQQASKQQGTEQLVVSCC